MLLLALAPALGLALLNLLVLCWWLGAAEPTRLAFVDYYRSRVLDPMGLDGFWCGVPEELQPALDIADVVRGPCSLLTLVARS